MTNEEILNIMSRSSVRGAKMTLETLLSEISDAGFFVNNLFQLDSGCWQANLRTSTHHCEFAVGATPIEALSLCLDLIETAELFAEQPASFSIETKPALSAILANLLPKQQKINRRL